MPGPNIIEIVVSDAAGAGALVLPGSGSFVSEDWLQATSQAIPNTGFAVVSFSFTQNLQTTPREATLRMKGSGLIVLFTQSATASLELWEFSKIAGGLHNPGGIGVDLSGNVYICDT